MTATIRQAIDDLAELRMRAHVTPGFLDFDEVTPRTPWAWEGEEEEEEEEDYWLPAAGVPWFVSLFGRDALITSLQALPVSIRTR